jgi:hypothetical protein
MPYFPETIGFGAVEKFFIDCWGMSLLAICFAI